MGYYRVHVLIPFFLPTCLANLADPHQCRSPGRRPDRDSPGAISIVCRVLVTGTSSYPYHAKTSLGPNHNSRSLSHRPSLSIVVITFDEKTRVVEGHHVDFFLVAFGQTSDFTSDPDFALSLVQDGLVNFHV